MPTNLKSLLTRSRSKNELKLRDSRDEISPSGSNSESSSSESSCQCCKCESSSSSTSSEPHCSTKVTCCCRESSESCSCTSSKGGEPYLTGGNERESHSFPAALSADLSYKKGDCSKSDETQGSCFMSENFRRGLTSGTPCPTTTMMPNGKCFRNASLATHNIHNELGSSYLCSQQNYTSYDVPPTTAATTGSTTVGDYCGYYLDEKQNIAYPPPPPPPSSRQYGMMDQRRDIRRNASCKTLFFSCTTLHQPSCSSTSFEPSHHHLDPTSEFSPSSCETSVTSNGKVAAVPSSINMPSLSHARTTMVDDCGSLACKLPSAACCTLNVKDGSPCQSLSMRKCETVLALSNFHGGSGGVPATSTHLTSSGNPYSRSSTSGGSSTYSNFPSGGPTGAAMSHLSSSSITSSNVGGKVRVMKEKIFSTSSSALNCLLHSSSRTGKLFSGWKLSSAGNSSHSGSSTNVGHISAMHGGINEGSNCLGANCHPNKHFLAASGISNAASSSASDKLGSTIHTGHPHKSRSQLSILENGFSGPAPLTPINRLRRNISVNNSGPFCAASGSLSAHSSYSRSSSVASFGWKEREDPFEQGLLCRLCLCNVRLEDTMEILACSCRYCKDCLINYVSFEIQQGADEIACPDASCEKQGVLGLLEMEQLVSPMLMEKHKKFRLFREVEKDSTLMWCPSPGCETICQVQDGSSILTGGFAPETDGARGGAAGGSRSPLLINCPTCRKTYCAECKLSWHPDSSCESFRRKLIKQGELDIVGFEMFEDKIKQCPFCHVPIEKDSGCAQMMCKRCKHVFCWYCLASLDDDFLLRHYDKGPCKNKLGHSRASVVWHRAQVIGIFAGFGVLVLLASPLLILAAPCLLCCRCRYCANKLDLEESPVSV